MVLPSFVLNLAVCTQCLRAPENKDMADDASHGRKDCQNNRDSFPVWRQPHYAGRVCPIAQTVSHSFSDTGCTERRELFTKIMFASSSVALI